MKRQLTPAEIEKRFAAIDRRTPEEPTASDRKAIADAEAEDPTDAVSLEEYKAHKEYSGRLLLRIPKELHRDLAESAKRNGVSLNQYVAYKLAR